MQAELKLHAKKVKKYIILHDTTTFATVDETHYETVFGMKVNNKGLWLAIEEFLEENKNWKLLERFTNNNGLTILEKIKRN